MVFRTKDHSYKIISFEMNVIFKKYDMLVLFKKNNDKQ